MAKTNKSSAVKGSKGKGSKATQENASAPAPQGSKGKGKGKKANATPEVKAEPAAPVKGKGKGKGKGKPKLAVLTPTSAGRQRGLILRFPITQAIRWWGHCGATQVQILEALAKLGMGSVSPTTVSLQRTCGARTKPGEKGTHGYLPEPTEEEKRQLAAMLPKA